MSRARKELRDQLQGTRIIQSVTLKRILIKGQKPELNIDVRNIGSAQLPQFLRDVATLIEQRAEAERAKAEAMANRNPLPETVPMPG